MRAAIRKEVISSWSNLQKHIPLHPISTEKQYDRAVESLNELLDIIGNDEDHPMCGILHALGGFVKEYEDAHHQIPKVTGVACLRFLMEQHGLKQTDLADLLGGQSVVSGLLSGKRELNIRQIRLLSARFNVSPAVFF